MSGVNHIAFICDGNGRWAKQRGLPRTAGHIAGLYKTQTVVEWCVARNLPNISAFLWSTENWKRDSKEIHGIMDAVVKHGPSFIARMHRLGVRLIHAGLRDGLEDRVLKVIDYGADLTKDNTRANFCLAFNYGGKLDILHAVNHAVEEASLRKSIAGEPASVTAEAIGRNLMSYPLPDIDLLVRSGNETRISNFMLWQAAFADLSVSASNWPDFSESELDLILHDFNVKKQGALSEQDRMRRQGRAPRESAEIPATDPSHAIA